MTGSALGIRPAPATGTLVAYHGPGGHCRLWTVAGPCGCARCEQPARLLIAGPPMILACAQGGTERLLHVRPAMVTVADPAAPGYRARWVPVRERDGGNAGLTLGERQELAGRSMTQRDNPRDPWYCVNCLADLPADQYEWYGHRCETAAPPAMPSVEHKTCTSQPHGWLEYSDGSCRFDKRGRPVRDPSSWAICSCGWVGAGRDRPDARRRAREHREQATS
jgi:hypothetical protein